MRRDLVAKLYDGVSGITGDGPSPGASAQNRYAKKGEEIMYKKYGPIAIIIMLLITSCGISESELASIVEETQSAIGMPVPITVIETVEVPVTVTVEVTRVVEKEVLVTPTEKPLPEAESARRDFRKLVIEMVEDFEDVELLNSVKIEDGVLEIEFMTRWASRDRQPDISYKLIKLFAEVLIRGDVDDELAQLLFDGNNPTIRIVSYSTDGDYRYSSNTSWLMIKSLFEKSITYQDWVEGSSAGFK